MKSIINIWENDRSNLEGPKDKEKFKCNYCGRIEIEIEKILAECENCGYKYWNWYKKAE